MEGHPSNRYTASYRKLRKMVNEVDNTLHDITPRHLLKGIEREATFFDIGPIRRILRSSVWEKSHV